jgi:hypothetical protein
MSTMRLGEYDVIFDEGVLGNETGKAPQEGSSNENRVKANIEGVRVMAAAPFVVSDVLQPNNQQTNRAARQKSPHLQTSNLAVLIKSSPTQALFTTPHFDRQIEMDRKRLRARPEPKPIPAEVSEAIALMDQEIRNQDRGHPKKRGRGRPKGSKLGMLSDMTLQGSLTQTRFGRRKKCCRIGHPVRNWHPNDL